MVTEDFPVASSPEYDEYLAQLRDAIASGQIQGTPQPDGSWILNPDVGKAPGGRDIHVPVIAGQYAPAMQDSTATATQRAPTQYEDGSTENFAYIPEAQPATDTKASPFGVAPKFTDGSELAPEAIRPTAQQWTNPFQKIDQDRFESKRSSSQNEYTLKQLGLDPQLGRLTQWTSGVTYAMGVPPGAYYQDGRSQMPPNLSGPVHTQVAFHEGVIHPIEDLLSDSELDGLYDLMEKHPSTYGQAAGESFDPPERGTRFHSLTGYFDEHLGDAQGVRPPEEILQYIRDITPNILARSKVKKFFPPGVQELYPVGREEEALLMQAPQQDNGQSGMEMLARTRYQLTGETDQQVQQAILSALSDVPDQARKDLLFEYRNGIAPKGATTVGGKLTGLGLSRSDAWDRMVAMSEEIVGGGAQDPWFEQYLAKAEQGALIAIDPITAAGKAALGEEAWNELPQPIRTAASWAPVILAPETGLFKKGPLKYVGAGGAGLKTGSIMLGGAVVGDQVAELTGVPAMPSQLIGAFTAGGVFSATRAMVAKATREGIAVEDDVFRGMGKDSEEVLEAIMKATGSDRASAQRFLAENSFAINEAEAAGLNAVDSGIRAAAPDDMVTLYHATDADSALRISENGLSTGKLSSDPEAARLNALADGVEDPKLVAFQVPRKLVNTTADGFSPKTKLDATENEVTQGFVHNVAGVVRAFLRGETDQITGQGLHSGVPNPFNKGMDIPDDVAAVAFGSKTARDLKWGSDRDQVLRERDDARMVLQDLQAKGDYSSPAWQAAMETVKGIDESGIRDLLPVDDALEARSLGQFSDGFVRDAYAAARKRASQAQDNFDQIDEMGVGGTRPETARGELYSALADVQRYGEELAARTQGKEGVTPQIDRALRQYSAEMEGGIYYHAGIPMSPAQIDAFFHSIINAIPGGKPPTQKVIKTNPASHTVKLLGDVGVIVKPTTRPDQVFNVLKRGLNSLPGIQMPRFDGLAAGIIETHRRGRATIESRANALAAHAHYLTREPSGLEKMRGRNMGFEMDNEKGTGVVPGMRIRKGMGRITNLPGAPTMQDVAAKLPRYWKHLTPNQQYAFTKLKQMILPYYNALIEQGLELGTRRDIMDGGFYLPRGRTQDGLPHEFPTIYASGRSAKKGFEKLAEFDSMTDAYDLDAEEAFFIIMGRKAKTTTTVKGGGGTTTTSVYDPEFAKFAKDFHGFEYGDFASTMEAFFRDAGTRVLDSHIANVLRTSTDAVTGDPLWTTAESRLLLDPKNAKLKARVDRLRKEIASLAKSLDGLDGRIHAQLLTFIHSPAPDLADLRLALNALSTSGGTLRVRGIGNNVTDATRTKNINVLKAEFSDLYKEITQEVFRNKGKYKGLTGEQARNKAFTDALNKIHINRGAFKGVDFATGKAMLDRLKDTLNRPNGVLDQWVTARDLNKMNTPRGWSGLEKRNFGAHAVLNDHAFAEGLASSLNSYLKSTGLTGGNGGFQILQAANGLMRGLNAGLDLSFSFITGMTQLAYDKGSYKTAMQGALRTMFDPIHGRYVLGKFVDDFDNYAMANGLPTAVEWTTNGLRMGGIDTEYMLGGKRGIGHVLGDIPGIRQSNRAFGYFGDILRLEGAQKQLQIMEKNASGGLMPTQRAKAMRELSQSQNLLTGWSPGRTLGAAGDLVLFAPRFLQSQLELVTKGLNVFNRSQTNNQARAALLSLVGQGVGLIAAANILLNEEDFNWWAPFDERGNWNTNFMRIRFQGRDISLFGPWDSLLRATVYAAQGDPFYLARTKASPIIARSWDLITGENFMGDKVPKIKNLVKGDDWGLMPEYLLRSMLPFSIGEDVANVATGEKTLKEAGTDFAIGVGGLKESPLSESEKHGQDIRDITREIIRDRAAPAAVLEVLKNTDYYSLSSAERKLVDREFEKRRPAEYAGWIEYRREEQNIYQIIADEADRTRGEYHEEYNALLERLLGGESPKVVWEAYDDVKNRLSGALTQIYDGGLSESKKYQEGIDGLPMNDIRRIEAEYNGIVKKFQIGSDKSVTFDWAKIDEARYLFIRHLNDADPDMADRFVETLKLNEKFSVEDAHPLVQLKKLAAETLQPYYAIVDKDPAKQAQAREDWLVKNPKADVDRWIVANTDSPTVTSVRAAQMAMQTIPNRDIKIAGSSLEITPKNLPTLLKYDKEITRLITIPTEAVVDGKKIAPRTELRKNDALYDALYFYMGFSKGDEDKTAVVYHLAAVNDYLRQWGQRSDGVRPRLSR